MVCYSTSLPIALSLHRRALNMSLTYRKNLYDSQLTGTDQNASKFTLIRYGTVISEFTLGRKILNRKFKANSDFNRNIFHWGSTQLLKSRKIQIASDDSKQPSGNMLHGCLCHTSRSGQGQQIKCSSGRCTSSGIIKALTESWTRKVIMYCGCSKFTYESL